MALLFQDLAENIGRDWKRLATKLGLTAQIVEDIQNYYKNNLNEQAYQMLFYWWRRNAKRTEAINRLIFALDVLGRADLARVTSGKNKIRI